MNFIKGVSVAVLWSTLSVMAMQAQNFTVSGRVVNSVDAGIAGVVVSDGFTATATNDQGEYALKSHSGARHVFISIPSGYGIPHDGNIPRFYMEIKGTTTDITADFVLSEQEKQHDLVLTVMADPQVQVKADLNRFATEAIPDIEQLKTFYPENTGFIGMTAGDLMWDAPGLLPGYAQAFRQLSFPFFQVIGNHDYDQQITGNDTEAAHYFEAFFGPAYYSFNRGDCHFVALDNIIYTTRKEYEEEISKEQLEWLKADLSFVDKDKLIVVSMHAPNFRRNNEQILSNSTDLLNILEGYEVLIVSGHSHRMNMTRLTSDITEYTLSPAMGLSWSGDINNDGTPNGYGVFEIKGNKLVNQYFKSTSQHPDHQLRIYPVGKVSEYPSAVVANVWNYRKGWTVEVYEDGEYKGKMTNFTGYDPIAYNYFLGPKEPKRKPGIEPVKTPTLFYYTPSNEKAEIKVVVTTEFGKSYPAVLTKATGEKE